VVGVFDFGPAFGIRPRTGDAITLVPPFGASFVAWDDDVQIQAWIDRAQPRLTSAEVSRYYSALSAVRARGYSITVSSGRQPELASALDKLIGDAVTDEAAGDARRMRDEAIRTVTHSEYLASEVDPQGTTRLTQVSAPVFSPDGLVAASIMMLGPSHDVSAAEITAKGELVLAAAGRATHDIGGRPSSGNDTG
jgi:DNA-binding IclR family transcriptional regulator